MASEGKATRTDRYRTRESVIRWHGSRRKRRAPGEQPGEPLASILAVFGLQVAKPRTPAGAKQSSP